MRKKRFLSLTLALLLLLPLCHISLSAQAEEPEVLRAGFFAYPGYHVMDEDGHKSGYGYEFLQRLSIHAGWNYEYVGYEGSYNEALDMLEKGEVDILTSVSKTPEREEKFLFSDQDIGANSTIFTVKAGNRDIVEGDYPTYDGIVVGMLEGNSKNENFERFAETHSFSFQPLYFEEEEALSDALQEGRIDAAVTGSLRLLENEWLLESFDATPFYVCVNKNRPDLMERVNKAIAEMDLHDPNWRTSLHDDYYSTDLEGSILINAEERAFLDALNASGKPLRVLVNPSQSPYSYFQDGEARGILPSIFEELAERLSFTYEYIPVKDQDEYYDLRAKSGVDVVLDFSGDYSLAEEEGYKITVPYFQTNFARLTRRDFTGTVKRIAVEERSDALYSYTINRSPEDTILTYGTADECVEAVLNGEADAANFYTYTARQYVSNDARNRLVSTVLGEASFSYAVDRTLTDGRYLLSLLDKGSDSFTGTELDSIVERELGAVQDNHLGPVDFMYRYPVYSIVGIFSFLLLFFSLFLLISRIHNQHLLEKKVAQATSDLEDKTQELSAALEAADAASRAKTVFLNNMSHDIRTPMNAIIGYTSLATTHIDNKERALDYLSKITQASSHLLALINDVLDMSRIESGKVVIHEKAENLADILQNLRNIIQSDIHAKQMVLYIDTVDVKDEEIFCDRLRLNQILLNLASNAIKFTPAGGTIDIRVTQKPSQEPGSAIYEFRVADTGVGMDPEFAKTVFEPFTREQTSTVSGIQGTGLGMAITKNIVDMMGGTISVQSERGKGTIFIVDLELKIAESRQETGPIQELKNFHGLVVDDDLICCQSASKMLRQAGVRTEWALSGREAIARTSEAIDMGDPFGVYIVDWSMPDQGGVETVRQIREIVGEASPIILMSAYDWSDIEREARRAGVTGFVSKPLFDSDLRRVLRLSLEEPTQEKSAPELPEKKDDFSGKRILLVEDIALNREIVVEILGETGISIECAENGKVACDMVSQSEPGYYDLILMDIQMPVMDGYAAARAIRAMDDPALSQIPIIAMTANAFEEDKKKAIDAGMNAHLPKPIELDTMMGLLHEMLDTPSA